MIEAADSPSRKEKKKNSDFLIYLSIPMKSNLATR